MKKTLSVSLELEDPTPERLQEIIRRVMDALKGNVRRGDVPWVNLSEEDGD